MSADMTSLEVESERTYVVYDRSSGEIVHIHRITVHSGAERMPDDRAELRAREVAVRFGQREDSIAILRADDFDFRRPQRVDVTSGRLVTEDQRRSSLR